MYIDKSKAKKHQVQYRTSDRRCCASSLVVSITVCCQWWLSIAVRHRRSSVVVIHRCGRRWSSVVVVHHHPSSLVVVFAVHHRPSLLSVIGDHRPSQSIAVAIAIHCHRRRHLSSVIVVHCHSSSSVVVVSCHCRSSSLVFVIGCQSSSLWLSSTRRWLSSLVVSCQSSSLWLSVMVVNAIVALPVMGAAPPWPRAPPASSLLAGLRKPPLQGVRHWSPGRMAGQKMGFFEGHAGRDVKGGWVTASASNGRRVSTWKSASAGHSQQLHTLAAVRMGIVLVTVVRRLWGCQPHVRKVNE